MTTNAKETRHLLLLTLGCVFLFFYGAASLPFLGPDEPRYAQVARQMFESGDYVTPHLGSAIWFEKPVLLYWLMAACYAMFGVTEFAARLPSALAALGTVLIVYKTARTLQNALAALLSAVVLATTAFFIGFSHAATFDMLLTFCVTGALCCFLLFQQTRKNKFLWLFYAAAGFGVLAKGFVALVILAVAVFTYLLVSRRLRDLWNLKPIHGIVIVTAVTSIWFLPVTWQHGWHFWDEFFYQHHVVRYTSSHYHRSGGFFYYLPILILGTFPWTFALLSKDPQKTGNTQVRMFCWCWMVGTVLFFSFSQSKLPGYILPAAPAFAMLAGDNLSRMHRSPKWPIAAALFLNAAVAAALLWGARMFAAPARPVWIMIVCIALILAIALWLLMQNRYAVAFLVYCLMPLAAMLIFLNLLYPHLNFGESKLLTQELKSRWSEGQYLALFNVYDFAPVFYLNGRVELTPEGYLYNIDDYRHLHRYLKTKNQAWILAANEDVEWMNRVDFWKVGRTIHGPQHSIIELTMN